MKAPFLFATGLSVLPASLSAEIDDAAIADAGARYQRNCMGCHQPPDTRFATDLAWIGQIRETA